jgi:hypothetical protein
MGSAVIFKLMHRALIAELALPRPEQHPNQHCARLSSGPRIVDVRSDPLSTGFGRRLIGRSLDGSCPVRPNRKGVASNPPESCSVNTARSLAGPFRRHPPSHGRLGPFNSK